MSGDQDVDTVGVITADWNDDELIIDDDDDEDDDSLGSVQDLVNTVSGATTGGTSSTTSPGVVTRHGASHSVSEPLSANTKRNMQWAVRVWQKWAFYKNTEREPDHNKIPTGKEFLSATAGEIAKACSLFITTVTKSDGSLYPPHSLYNLLFAISRYIKFELKRQEIDILDFRKPVNAPIQEAMDEVTRKYSESENTCDSRADAITWEHVKILWDKGVLNYHTAKGISRAAFIYNSKVFGIRSGRDHRLLLLEYFEFGEDDTGRYAEFHKGKFYKAKKEANGAFGNKFSGRVKMNSAAMAAIKSGGTSDDVRIREYEVVGNQRCAYAVHKTYLDTVHQYVRYGPFYIKPLPTEPGTRIRFTSAAVGHNSLGTYVKDMMGDAGISGYFTNLSAGKQETTRQPDWAVTPNEDQNLGPIIVSTAGGVTTGLGATTYVQLLNRNVPIAPKPLGEKSKTGAAVKRIAAKSLVPQPLSATSTSGAKTFAIASPETGGQRQIFMIPINKPNSNQVTFQRVLAPARVQIGSLEPAPALTSTVTTAATTTCISTTSLEEQAVTNSVTVKQEVVSDDEGMQMKAEPEDDGYTDAPGAAGFDESAASDFYANYMATETEEEQQQQQAKATSSSSLDLANSRKRPLEIEPITEEESESMTSVLIKKLKALEDRLHTIETGEKPPSSSPDVPDSSQQTEKSPPKKRKTSADDMGDVMDKLRVLESRVGTLENSKQTRSSNSNANLEAKMKTLEKTVEDTKKAVNLTNTKLNQTNSKLDKIMDILVSSTHSRRK